MKTRTLILLLACLALGMLAGCSATTDNYVETVNQIQGDVLEASSDVGSDANASKNDIIASLEDAESEARGAVDELNDIDVPSEAEAGHDELVAGFEELTKLLAGVREQVEAKRGASAFAELRSKGAVIDKRIDAAIDQINSDLGLD